MYWSHRLHFWAMLLRFIFFSCSADPKRDVTGSCWFARSSWLATVARTSILFGTWPMLYYVSLALSVSRFWFCHWFCYLFFVAPYVLVCCHWLRFFRVYVILMVVLLLLLILFPDGFLLCDHGLDFLDHLMWEFNQSKVHKCTILSCMTGRYRSYGSQKDIFVWATGWKNA